MGETISTEATRALAESVRAFNATDASGETERVRDEARAERARQRRDERRNPRHATETGLKSVAINHPNTATLRDGHLAITVPPPVVAGGMDQAASLLIRAVLQTAGPAYTVVTVKVFGSVV